MSDATVKIIYSGAGPNYGDTSGMPDWGATSKKANAARLRGGEKGAEVLRARAVPVTLPKPPWEQENG